MARLGYDRYVAQGGDWGSAVTRAIGAQDARALRGHPHHAGHGNSAARRWLSPRPTSSGRSTASSTTKPWDSGYSKQQATRPQTLGYGLADSPAGQAAWILEKFWAWTDCDGHPENVLASRRAARQRDVLLGHATARRSSARIYWESFGKARATQLTVPVGVTVYPKEIVTPVRSWMEADYPNIVYWSEQPQGGHFAAFEQPELFVADVRRSASGSSADRARRPTRRRAARSSSSRACDLAVQHPAPRRRCRNSLAGAGKPCNRASRRISPWK